MSYNPNNGLNSLQNPLPLWIVAEYPKYAKFCNYVNNQFGGATQWNWNLFDTLYRTSWIAKKCVTVLTEDMVDKWRVFEHDDPEILKKRIAYEEENRISSIYQSAINQARLYGGSALIPILKSQFNDETFKKQFLLPSVQKDDLHGFQVLTKFDFAPEQGINRDIFNSPETFGDFIYYKIIRIQSMVEAPIAAVTNEPINSIGLPTIHVSRMIKLYGTELFYYQKFFSGGWGDSILVPLIDKIPAIEEAFHLLYLYLDLFNIDEIGIQNLTAIVNANGGAQLFRKYKQFRDLMRQAKLRFMDANDKMNRNQINSIQNIVPVMDKLMQFVVGVSSMPITKIFGTGVGGFSVGDNELSQWYDTVAQEQKRLEPSLSIVDEIIERSLFGKKMGIRYKWVSKREMTEKEKADVKNQNAQTFQIYLQNKVMTPKVVGENIKTDFNGIDEDYLLTLDEDFLDFESVGHEFEDTDGEEEKKNDSGEISGESKSTKTGDDIQKKDQKEDLDSGDLEIPESNETD